MPVLTDIGLLVTPVRGERQGVLLTIKDAALAWTDGRLRFVGPRSELPSSDAGDERVSADGGLVVPGLVDCHTHLAFGGWRAAEFEQRILGRSYLDIAREGGGIQYTVARTLEATDEALLARCRSHLAGMAALGVTTVECKSGYGLSVSGEHRLLDLYHTLASTERMRIVPTLLAAHALPAEYRERREAYVTLVRDELVPQVAARGRARFCDVFVEEGAFTTAEARAILQAASAVGLRGKLHADQLRDGGGAALAADEGAVSADHLEHVSARGIARLAAAGTVAVSLPLATLYLGERPLPARALLDAGVPLAVATDFNPGSAPSYHLPLAMMLACTLQRMTPSEVLCGATLMAAKALDLDHEVGVLETGLAADFAVIDAPDVDHWLYHFRANACVQTWARGQRIA